VVVVVSGVEVVVLVLVVVVLVVGCVLAVMRSGCGGKWW